MFFIRGRPLSLILTVPLFPFPPYLHPQIHPWRLLVAGSVSGWRWWSCDRNYGSTRLLLILRLLVLLLLLLLLWLGRPLRLTLLLILLLLLLGRPLSVQLLLILLLLLLELLQLTLHFLLLLRWVDELRGRETRPSALRKSGIIQVCDPVQGIRLYSGLLLPVLLLLLLVLSPVLILRLLLLLLLLL